MVDSRARIDILGNTCSLQFVNLSHKQNMCVRVHLAFYAKYKSASPIQSIAHKMEKHLTSLTEF